MTPTALEFPSSLPAAHRGFLSRALSVLQADARLVGVAAGGSYIENAMDEFSDLDLLIVVEPSSYAQVLEQRVELAARLGSVLSAFTGEHVGEPRLLICLYGPPLLHVDLKFVSVDALASRVEDPAVLWERDGRLSAALAVGDAQYPQPDPQWIEDRFWVWVHYAAAKLGRGETFEAVQLLAFLRGSVLGPLALQSVGARPSGVRRIERVAPELARRLARTLSGLAAAECAAALRASIELYVSLRTPELSSASRAERPALDYLAEVERRLGPHPR